MRSLQNVDEDSLVSPHCFRLDLCVLISRFNPYDGINEALRDKVLGGESDDQTDIVTPLMV